MASVQLLSLGGRKWGKSRAEVASQKQVFIGHLAAPLWCTDPPVLDPGRVTQKHVANCLPFSPPAQDYTM